MSKNLNISILMDFYGKLLTSKQLETLDMYYNQDFSLAEIAEVTNISRQGVRDSIKRGEKQLFELEDKLGLAGRFISINADIEKINALADRISEQTELTEISQIKSLLKKLMDNL